MEVAQEVVEHIRVLPVYEESLLKRSPWIVSLRLQFIHKYKDDSPWVVAHDSNSSYIETYLDGCFRSSGPISSGSLISDGQYKTVPKR